MKKRVVVTGIGVVSPVGSDKETFWSNLMNGVSGIKKVEHFDASGIATQIAGIVEDFNPTDFIDKKEAKRMDRNTQLAIAAADMAVKDSGLDLESINKERVGVIFGSGIGGMQTFEDQTLVLDRKGPNRVSPFLVPMMIANMSGGQIAIKYGFKGPNITTVTACASSTNAIGDAFKLIQRGDADLVVSGGSEAPITPIGLAGFSAMKAMSTRNDQPEKASRPFDAERDGFVMGEGGAVVILESLEHAVARNAHIYAEVVGYGCTCDASHITAPDPEGAGAARAMELAIKDANLNPDDITYINAHGTSTPLNDKCETMAIKTAFGEYAKKVNISSTKSMTGHLLGAAGGVEAIVCALAIERNQIPPTINYENPDSECDLDYVPNQGREVEVNAALSNSLGFGGHNSTIVLKKYNK